MKLVFGILLVFITAARSEDPSDNLPLCPLNMQFFPQNLPMHCKMPFKVNNNTYPPMAAAMYPQQQMASMQGMGLPQMYQSVPSGGSSPQMAQMPSQSGGYMGVQVPQMQMMAMPGMAGMPGMPGMPMPLPPKSPMVVMPYYAPTSSQKFSSKKKKKQHKKTQKPYGVRYYETWELPLDRENANNERIPKDSLDMDLYDSIDLGDISEFDFKGRKSIRRRNKNHQKQKSPKSKKSNIRRSDPLTPVLQYVSKDGYVIYEKELTQNEAHDYLTEKPTATTKHVVEERFAPVRNVRRLDKESQSNEDTYDTLYHDFEDNVRIQASGKDRKNGEDNGRNKKFNIKSHSSRRHNNQKEQDGRPI